LESITIRKSPVAELNGMREKFLEIIDNQFTYDKCHLYGWSDVYLILKDGFAAGYGALWGRDKRIDRDSIFEFYLDPQYWIHAHDVFQKFIEVSKADWIQCQSNDPLLSEMFFEFATDICAEAILFEDDTTTNLSVENAKIEAVVNPEASKMDRPYVIKHNDEVVANGGLLLNYNFPYADIYYGVEEAHRRKGFGSFFVQELKKEAYRMGRVPAARTNIDNMVSKRTMMKAGLKPCGFRLGGKIKKGGS
jgi:GNAT superfamily N-acetyltransferase